MPRLSTPSSSRQKSFPKRGRISRSPNIWVSIIAFVSSPAGAQVFGAEQAKAMEAHAREIQAAGAKYCDCPACALSEKILAMKADLLG